MNDTNAQSMDWLDAELQDTLDEMFENELSQPMMSVQMRQLYKDHVQNPLDRRVYYKNLLRLQKTFHSRLNEVFNRNIVRESRA